MKRVRRKTTQDNLMGQAILHDLERLVSAEAIAYQHSMLPSCSVNGLGIKHFCEPLQAYYQVSVTRIRECVVLSWCRERRPIGSVSGRRPDHHRLQVPTISAYALDCCHHLALHSRTSVVPSIATPYENLDRPKLR
jgi:hypothetical protein